jgi:hypothetical protein
MHFLENTLLDYLLEVESAKDAVDSFSSFRFLLLLETRVGESMLLSGLRRSFLCIMATLE